MLLDVDGNVWSAGANSSGQCGHGTREHFVEKFTKIQNLPKIQEVKTGVYHTVLLDVEGCIWGFGYNVTGKLGTGTKAKQLIPKKRENRRRMWSILCAGYATLAIDEEGTVWGTGCLIVCSSKVTFEPVPNFAGITMGRKMRNTKSSRNSVLQVETTNFASAETIPTPIPQSTKVVELTVLPNNIEYHNLSVGGNFLLLLDTEGFVWGCGQNDAYQLGLNNYAPSRSKILTRIEFLPPIMSIFTGSKQSYFIDFDGSVLCCGNGEDLHPISGLPPIQRIFTAQNCTFFLDTQESLWATGNWTVGSSDNVVRLEIKVRVKSVVINPYLHFILDEEGIIWELVDNSTVRRMENLPRIRSSSTLYDHTLILDEEGCVWSAGENIFPKSGNFTIINRKFHQIPKFTTKIHPFLI